MKTKTQLRQEAAIQRQQLDVGRISKAIVVAIQQEQFFQTAKNVLLYYPFRNEIDVMPLCEIAEKAYFLPRIEGDALVFHQYWSGDALITHRHGMQEPAQNQPVLSGLAETDLVVVPALMADRSRYRLGYGKGYYDRFLAGLTVQPVTLCVVPDVLLVDELPRDDWDHPLGIVMTEKQLV